MRTRRASLVALSAGVPDAGVHPMVGQLAERQ